MTLPRILVLTSFAATCILASSDALADQIYVESATGSAVSANALSTATELIKTAVPSVGSDTVTEQLKQADYRLRPKLLRLGEAYVLSLSKIRKGQVVFASQLKAMQMEDLDEVAQRLTRSVLREERISPAREDDLGGGSDEGRHHKPAHRVTYLGFGGAAFTNLNATGIGLSIAAAQAWDVDNALIKILGEGDFNGSAFFTSVSLGGNYFLTSADVAPYVTGDFGAGVAKLDGGGVLDGQTVVGFAGGAGAGVQFLRASSVHLDLGFRAGFLFHANQLGIPQAYTLRIGLYF
jgi:hypothetical protein